MFFLFWCLAFVLIFTVGVPAILVLGVLALFIPLLVKHWVAVTVACLVFAAAMGSLAH
jgi:hypothetical protein